jgi:ubiquinone/menaquinone biosynthesis C-methylase UbiE
MADPINATSFQRDVFLAEEADQWFERNKERLTADRKDCLLEAINTIGLRPKRILEIGCANGWRLHQLHQSLGAQCVGLDPSQKAIAQGRRQFAGLDLRVGCADRIDCSDGTFDLVIFGFCFYLIDPTFHFRCVAEADRVLQDGGALAIHDFVVPMPYYNVYSHREGIRSYKIEVARYFLAHPAYSLIHRVLDYTRSELLNPDRREGVDILIKGLATAFPLNPFAESKHRQQ